MKLKLLFLFAVCICCTQYVHAQTETWAKKQSLGYDIPTRYEPVMTALKDKLYIVGGYEQSPYLSHSINDFWEYTPATKTYRRLKDFPEWTNVNWGGGLYAIKGKLYCVVSNGFYQYDFAKNEWITKASFPGDAYRSAGFVINNILYIAEGWGDGGGGSKRFFAYNISTNTWIQKANYPDNPIYGFRWGAVGFALNGYGYFGGGTYSSIEPGIDDGILHDFYKYDPGTDTWSSISPLPEGLFNAVAATVNGKAYVGTGLGQSFFNGHLWPVTKNAWYEYSDVSNTWAVKAPCPGSIDGAGIANVGADIFVFGGRGYVTTSNMMHYTAATDNWTIDTLNAGANRTNGMSFIINNKIYTGGGADGIAKSDWWEYDISTEKWTRKADIPGISPYAGRSVTVNANGKAYAIGGYYPYYDQSMIMAPKNLLEYNPSTNKWATKAAIPGDPRHKAAIFSIGNYVYAGLGLDSNQAAKNDFYKYNIATNKWTKVKNCPVAGDSRGYFTLNGKGYLLVNARTIKEGVYGHFFYEYDPVANKWTKKDIGIDDKALPIENAFTINNKIYFLVTDWLFYHQTKVVEYDPATGESRALTNAPLNITSHAVATDGSNAYLFGGITYDPDNNLSWRISNQLWKFTPNATVIDTVPGDVQGIKPDPVPFKNTANDKNATLYDSSGAILAAVSSNSSTFLTGASWSGRVLDKTAPYREKFWWFGNNSKEDGMFFNKNIFVTSYSHTATFRIYCTPLEIDNFVNAFNSKYGTSYTQADIKVVKYSGNTDLDPLNNINDKSYYKTILSQIKNYGNNNEYRYFEFANQAGAGEYYLVLSKSGCTESTITAGGPTTFCQGGSVKLTASLGASYLWSTGATTRSIIVNSSGNYTVSLTNENGCTKTSDATVVTVNAKPIPTTTPEGQVNIVSPNKVTISTNSTYNSYTWSNGTSKKSITTGKAGSYTVTVRDANGCTGTSAAVIVTVSPSFAGSGVNTNYSSSAKTNAQQGGLKASLSPNPAHNYAILRISGTSGAISVTLTDMAGKAFWKSSDVNSTQVKLPVSNLSSGIYLVHITDGKEMKTLKLIKE